MSDYQKVKEWRKLNPEKVAEQARRYAAKHPETNKRAKEKYRSANVDKVRESDRLSQANRRRSNPEQQRERYERWRAKREAELTALAGRPRANSCEICHEEGKTVFDHCHANDHFRGWICDRCNKVLGLVNDDRDLLRNLARYLFYGETHSVNPELLAIQRLRTTGGA